MTESKDRLFKVSMDDYGDAYRADYLAMYQDYVASADTISERRHSANSFFVTVNAALLGVSGYFGGDGENLVWLAAIAGVLFSFTWRRLIQSYRSLNSAKFQVIHQLEQRLPFAAYDEEWVQLKEGKDSSVHIPFSAVEALVPTVFMLLHASVFLANFYLWSRAALGWWS